MFTESRFLEFTAEIAALNGIPSDLASDYAAAIGDTPELAADGRAIVRNEAGREIARVSLPQDGQG